MWIRIYGVIINLSAFRTCLPAGREDHVHALRMNAKAPRHIGMTRHPGINECRVSHLLWDVPPSAAKDLLGGMPLNEHHKLLFSEIPRSFAKGDGQATNIVGG